MARKDTDPARRVEVPVQIPSPQVCSACTAQLTSAVDQLPGVGSVEIDPATSMLTANLVGDALSREDLALAVERIGYEVSRSVGHASWRITGLDCPDCARTVDVAIGRIDGVLAASLNFANAVLHVEFDRELDPREEIARSISSMGYGFQPLGDDAGRPVAEFEVDGLDCADCAESLRASIERLGGVDEVEIDFATARMRVGFDPGVISAPALTKELERAGYSGRIRGGQDAASEPAQSWYRSNRHEIATTAAGVLIAIGWLLGRSEVHEVLSAAVLVAAIVLGGALVGKRALASMRARILDMNVLMTIAVVGAVGIGEWLEGAMVVFLFSIGGLLESRSLSKTRSSIRDLMDLSPEKVRLVASDGSEETLSPADLSLGQRIRVLPGERIALDGTVIVGSSAVDESAITGESVPAHKAPGSGVFAGTLNTGGVLEIEVTSLSSDTTLARVVHLVEEAQAQQAPFQRLVDRFTRYYTPVVVVLAALIALLPPALGTLLGAEWGGFQEWFYRALVLLVVSCPCALVISTPVAVVSAITRASRDGVLVKGGAFLELAAKVKVMAFDKTGTLTSGHPEVADVIAFNGVDAAEVLRLAASVERHSTHPLAQAVVRAASIEHGTPNLAVEEFPGRGLRAAAGDHVISVGSAAFLAESGTDLALAEGDIERLETDGHTIMLLARDDVLLGAVGIADQVRGASAEVLSSLSKMGVKTVMLTGDNERTAASIGSQVGVDEVRARLLPQDKLDVVSELQSEHGVVVMVGDGINDAPALAAADIGIAMGAGSSDTALDTADVALISDDLSAILGFLSLGRRTVANIWQNVIASIAVKLAVLVAAAFGVATLWMAVFADTGVALLVILNGLRLMRARSS